MRRTLVAAALVAAFNLMSIVAQAQQAPVAPATATVAKQSGRLYVNGISYYYEIHGRGKPVLLLHGGLGSIDMFAGAVLPQLAATRQVIAVDLQGHGRTPLGTRPFSVQAMGDDMSTLVKQLGYGKVDVMGYSLGGGVALRMALQNPQRVERLVLVSTSYSDTGVYPAMHDMQQGLSGAAAPMMKDTPMFKSYSSVAPNVAEFPKLLDALGGFMCQKYDWSAEVSKLQMPVMLVYGDGDMFMPKHMVKFYQLLGGGQRDAGWGRETMSRNRLAILPDLTHYDIFTSPRLATTALPFLNGASNAKTWADQTAGR